MIIEKLTTIKLFTQFLFLLVLLSITSSIHAQGWRKLFPRDYPNKQTPQSGYAEITTSSDLGVVMAIQDHVYPDSIPLLDLTTKLIKVDQDGNEQWRFKYNNTDTTYVNPAIHDIQSTLDGGYIVSGDYTRIGVESGKFFVQKFDPTGNLEWEQSYFKTNTAIVNTNFKENNITVAKDGGYLVTSYHYEPNVIKGAYVIKIDSVGNVLWDKTFSNKNFFPYHVVSNEDNSFTIAGNTYEPVHEISGFLLTIDEAGNVLWDSLYNDDPMVEDWYFYDLVKTDDNGFIASGFYGSTSAYYPIIVKTDSLGKREWARKYPQFGIITEVTALSQANNGYLLTISDGFFSYIVKIDEQGNIVWNQYYDNTVWLDITSPQKGIYYISGLESKNSQIIKMDDDGVIYNNFLVGNVIHETNLNCTIDTNEVGFENWMLQAVGSNGSFYGITDASGFYKIDLDTGQYNLEVIPPAPVWDACLPVRSVSVNLLDTITNDFTERSYYDCPYLLVDVSTPSARLCSQNTYSVSYCNQGSVPATNAYIEVDFPPFMHVISSTLPWSAQTGNSFEFQLGTLNTGDCGIFQVIVFIDCDSLTLGETLCVEANAFPDTLCTPSDGSWDGSITSLDVSCGQDSVTFLIKNTGSGDMQTPLEFLVIEDDLIMKQNNFNLLSLDSLLVKVPANGSTYRMYAGQAPGHFPPGYHPTVAFEGCGVNSNGGFSMGYITMFPENDIMDQVSIDCQEIIGQYDLNGIGAEPKGYRTDHYIEQGDDLNYHIRFQNVGIDTVFNLVIRDTISPHLDIASLQQGTASHPYRLEIVNGNVLTFSFNDIKLVNSTTNEAASVGFVKFKISQLENLPIGTMIYNSAAIYFDYNEPVITNRTYHEIENNFVQVTVSSNEFIAEYPDLSIQVLPNPFTEYADFIIEDAPKGNKTFELYDAMGQLIRMESFSDDSRFRLFKSKLTAGVYFYQIRNNNTTIITGKLIAAH